jgi:hypothetical protein
MKVRARRANCGTKGAAGFRNCGKKAAKNSTALGLLAPTRKPRRKNERRCGAAALAFAFSTAASLRKVLIPSQIKYAAPMTLAAVKAVSDAARPARE